MTDELSPDLRSLFDAERRRDVEEIPPGAKDRVHAAIAASIGVGFGTAAGTGAAKTAALAKGSGAAAATKLAAASGAAATVAPAATATGGIVAKGLAIALVAAMAGTAGTGIYLANRDDKPKPAPAAVAHVVDPAPTFDPHALLPPEPKPAPVPAAPVVTHVAHEAPAHVSAAKPVETPEEKATRLAGERTVLDAARAAIAKGDGGDALIALEAHRDRYPDGALVEEREALTVMALAKLGRTDEAKAKAARFSAKYPQSLFAGAVEDAIKN